MVKSAFRMTSVFLLVILLAALLSGCSRSDSVVRAVLYYSPTCTHCEKVMQEDLPVLREKFGDRLQIFEINVISAEGQELYANALISYKVSRDRYGVPALFVGRNLLVGDLEIPEQFPKIIEQGLSYGGIDWPEIEGLDEALRQANHSSEPLQQGEAPAFLQKFWRDPVANSIAVLVLIGMIASLGLVAYLFLGEPDSRLMKRLAELPVWTIPVLCTIGMFAAVYLSYVEITTSEAFCGPIGDCNAVQESRYAKLWGVLPVGVVGLIGYIAILAAWLVKRYGPSGWRTPVSLAMWGMALIGTLFSAYLTFLEPFVIGATCAWCITSAVVITLLLWATTQPAVDASNQLAGEYE